VACEKSPLEFEKEHAWALAQSTRLAKHITRVGQNHIYTPYMTVYLVISLHTVYIGSWQTLHITTRCPDMRISLPQKYGMYKPAWYVQASITKIIPDHQPCHCSLGLKGHTHTRWASLFSTCPIHYTSRALRREQAKQHGSKVILVKITSQKCMAVSTHQCAPFLVKSTVVDSTAVNTHQCALTFPR